VSSPSMFRSTADHGFVRSLPDVVSGAAQAWFLAFLHDFQR
jgi:hypothetical protein